MVHLASGKKVDTVYGDRLVIDVRNGKVHGTSSHCGICTNNDAAMVQVMVILEVRVMVRVIAALAMQFRTREKVLMELLV